MTRIVHRRPAPEEPTEDIPILTPAEADELRRLAEQLVMAARWEGYTHHRAYYDYRRRDANREDYEYAQSATEAARSALERWIKRHMLYGYWTRSALMDNGLSAPFPVRCTCDEPPDITRDGWDLVEVHHGLCPMGRITLDPKRSEEVWRDAGDEGTQPTGGTGAASADAPSADGG